MDGVEIVPAFANRVANGVLGVVFGLGSLLYGTQAEEAWARVAAAVVGLGCAVLAVRGYRAGVRCEGGRLVVRGFLWTRVVPRAAVDAVTDFPAVRWTTPAGRKRWTPVTAFATVSGETAGARSRKLAGTAKLRRWAARG
ncbi:hypothetical protein ACF07V_09570 [Streptomyces sp. NPDC015661]|uniref:hypothetical protein n=1 Tax=Streptomyces sp. NPDC015661 TaxID=3364961 RepID=UPI0036F84084